MEKKLGEEDIEFLLGYIGEDRRELLNNVKEYKKALDRNEPPKYKWIRENIIDKGGPEMLHVFKLFRIFQIYTGQFIEKLATDIKKLNPQKIVEVCAGEGHLSKLLSIHGLESTPTDKKIDDINYPDTVETLSHIEAVEKYRPDTIIICWEPYQALITHELLNYDCVKYIVWIGEGYGGCTGNTYIFDNHKHRELHNEFALCRSDNSFFIGGLKKHSNVYLFEKEQTESTVRSDELDFVVEEEWVV